MLHQYPYTIGLIDSKCSSRSSSSNVKRQCSTPEKKITCGHYCCSSCDIELGWLNKWSGQLCTGLVWPGPSSETQQRVAIDTCIYAVDVMMTTTKHSKLFPITSEKDENGTDATWTWLSKSPLPLQMVLAHTRGKSNWGCGENVWCTEAHVHYGPMSFKFNCGYTTGSGVIRHTDVTLNRTVCATVQHKFSP